MQERETSIIMTVTYKQKTPLGTGRTSVNSYLFLTNGFAKFDFGYGNLMNDYKKALDMMTRDVGNWREIEVEFTFGLNCVYDRFAFIKRDSSGVFILYTYDPEKRYADTEFLDRRHLNKRIKELIQDIMDKEKERALEVA